MLGKYNKIQKKGLNRRTKLRLAEDSFGEQARSSAQEW
jgi:hypothetical protein